MQLRSTNPKLDCLRPVGKLSSNIIHTRTQCDRITFRHIATIFGKPNGTPAGTACYVTILQGQLLYYKVNYRTGRANHT